LAQGGDGARQMLLAASSCADTITGKTPPIVGRYK
jgi:hypothetical protein